ncbi:reverse transcriptase domain-containing protein [Tanacetum coccineum]|uniref:Reverse transcriptase domain-containing protein n=1 Tax=Tanacetum coccineum TaxID=301880 RepID=A0ABQ5AVW9_9ASTR
MRWFFPPHYLLENFELKVGLLQLVTSSQFHGFEREDPHVHIQWFNKITSTLKYRNVSNEAIKLMLFPFSLDGVARIWLEKEPPRSILTCENLVSKFVNHFFPPSKTTNLNNDITNFQQRFDESFGEAWDRFKDLLRKCPHHYATLKAIEETCVTCGGPHPYYECLATGGNTFDACAAVGTYNQGGNGYLPQGDPNYHASNQMGPPSFPPPNVQNSQNYNQNRYNQNQGNYQAPNNQGFNQQRGQNFNQGNNNYQAPNYHALNNQAQVGPSNELSNYMKSNEATLRAMQTQMGNMKSELRNEFKSSFINQVSSIETKTNKLENQNNQIMNMLTNLTIKRQSPSGLRSLPSDTVATPREVEREPEVTGDKNYLAVLLKKLPEKLGDPGKFLIPCDFPKLVECLALADLGASINLMPLSVWKKLSLPELTPTHMTLELVNRSVAYPIGVADDVFVKLGKALIDVHGEELILRDGDEKLIFHVDNTSKHPHKHGNESINMINFIDITCEDRFFEVLKFKKSNHPSSGSTNPLFDSFPSLTPFETSDSLLEEFADELALQPSIESSPKYDIEIIDPILERFTDKPAHIYSPLPGNDDNDNDDLFTTSLLVLPIMELLSHSVLGVKVDGKGRREVVSQVKSVVGIWDRMELILYLLSYDYGARRGNLITWDENLSTIPEKESDEFIKSSIEDLVLILSESEDTSDNDSECDLPFCDNSVTFSNHLFDSNDDFTFSDDESFLKEDDIENKDSYVSNLDEPVLLVTHLSDANVNECFDPGGDIGKINANVSTDFEEDYYNSEGDLIYYKSLLIKDIIPNLVPEVFLDHDPKSLNDEPTIEDLKIKENVRITFEDRHYLFLTFVIKIFLPFLTYLVNSLPLLSSRSEDTIFDPGISAYSFYSLEPVEYEGPMKNFWFFCFCPKDKGIRGEIAPDYEDSRSRGFVYRSLELQSLACLYMGIRYPRSY